MFFTLLCARGSCENPWKPLMSFIGHTLGMPYSIKFNTNPEKMRGPGDCDAGGCLF